MSRQRKIDSEELRRTNEALIDEMVRFNTAWMDGACVLLHARAGDRQVLCVETGGWYVCRTPGRQTVKFKGDNDAVWADLLRQAGVDRHPYFTSPPTRTFAPISSGIAPP